MTKTQIYKFLNKIEEQYNIEIIYAAEVGSRAYGYNTPDSDYDVRFLFRRPENEYLGINNKKDAITIKDGCIDASGWDIKKTLNLLQKSNGSLYELFHSPIVYKETDASKVLKNISSKYFDKRALVKHYSSMAYGDYQKMLTADKYTVKSVLFLTRATIMAECIMRSQYNIDVPINLNEILKTQSIDFTLSAWCKTLITARQKGNLNNTEDLHVVGSVINTANIYEQQEWLRNQPPFKWENVNTDLLDSLCVNIIKHNEAVFIYAKEMLPYDLQS